MKKILVLIIGIYFLVGCASKTQNNKDLEYHIDKATNEMDKSIQKSF